MLRLALGGLDQVHLVDPGEAVVERGAGQTVAVGHLDDVHAGCVEGAGDVLDLVEGELVADRVRPVAQRGVDDARGVRLVRIQRVLGGAHARTPSWDAPASMRSASRSPVRVAAEVMMSRLPAYSGR
ncbi:hypothetical protein SDC9_185501 [bioreactor metagenome]|uniref:Uncharacterized protein n=1 Tax=bioreactor metagenome TaxID=1076179 RepID=A0A645HGX0_9ZZZZ